jgi:plastocyanin
MKVLLVLVAAAAFAAPAAASNGVDITIRHQKVGCHAWAVGNGAYKATQSLTVKAGTALTFADNDVMPHTLIQLSGPKVALVGAYMHKIGAKTKIVLVKPGAYVFGTKAGEDYTKGVATVGEDNVLRLIVTVK